MSEQPLISVIIPVYNAAAYLPRCLESIFAQSYKNLEVVCVNDGSTDDSAEVLSDFAARDNRLRIFSQENRGAAAARNVGIKEAKGEYVSFVDADDYLLPGLYEHFIRELPADGLDIFMFNGQSSVVPPPAGLFFGRQAFKDEAKEGDIINHRALRNYFYGNQTICNKIYRTAFLRDNNLYMIEGNCFEDTHYYFATLIRAAKMKYTCASYYVYTVDNRASVTKSFGENSLGLFVTFDAMEREAKETGQWDFFRYALLQVEYEKILEIMKVATDSVRPRLFAAAREYLTPRVAALDAAICNMLVNFNLCKCLINFSYSEFQNTVLLSLEGYRFRQTPAENPLFSIIVPVYNVRRYLPFCMKSLINQTFTNMEIICVNDGSTDGVEPMLAEFAAKDARVKVISQPNRGLGGARNTGVQAAKGEYLLFVDSDDWLAVDALEKIAAVIRQTPTDIGLFGFYEYDEQKGSLATSEDYIASFRGLPVCDRHRISHLIYRLPCTWSKYYKRSFYQKNKLSFPEHVYFEDVAMNAKVFLLAKDISFCGHSLYFYRLRPGSIMKSAYSPKKVDDYVYSLSSTVRWLKKNGFYSEHKEAFSAFARRNLMNHLLNAGPVYGQMIKERINADKDLKKIFNFEEKKK